MNSPVEKLKSLRARKVEEIEKLGAHIAALRGIVDGIEVSIRELEGTAALGHQTPALIGKYRDMDLTPAVEDVVKTVGLAPGLSATEITTSLKAEGFNSNAKNLFGSVYAVAMRLVKQGKIGESKRDGKRTFVRK